MADGQPGQRAFWQSSVLGALIGCRMLWALANSIRHAVLIVLLPVACWRSFKMPSWIPGFSIFVAL